MSNLAIAMVSFQETTVISIVIGRTSSTFMPSLCGTIGSAMTNTQHIYYFDMRLFVLSDWKNARSFYLFECRPLLIINCKVVERIDRLSKDWSDFVLILRFDEKPSFLLPISEKIKEKMVLLTKTSKVFFAKLQ